MLDLIKGQRVEAAINIVAFTNKRWSPVVEKVLRSAVQNAVYISGEKGLDVDVDNLYVKTAIANEGPRMKRIRPAPMGRAFRYQRRISHIIVTVAEKKAAATVAADAPASAREEDCRQACAKKARCEEGRLPSRTPPGGKGKKAGCGVAARRKKADSFASLRNDRVVQRF